MRVLFDISALGAGRAVPLYRSGIFRYVQHIAAGLATTDEAESVFCAGTAGLTVWERFSNLCAALDYWHSDDTLRAVPFSQNRIIKSLVGVVSSVGWQSASPLLRAFRSAVVQRVLEHNLSRLMEHALHEVDIFHSPYYALPTLKTSMRGLRRFLTVHDLLPVLHPEYFEPGADSHFKALLGSVGPADWVLCNSESTRNDLCACIPALDRSRAFVTLLAADPGLFYRCDDEEKRAEARQRYKIPEGPYVLSVCTIEPRKNLDHLVECFFDLVRQENLADLHLILVGSVGWKNQKVFDQIIHGGDARSRIILTGYIRNEDMAAIYSSALMFVYPSLYEGFGLPPLEAMQCGVPVITSNTSSLPEVVGDAGILVNPRDHDQLCSSMLEVYQSSSLRAALSAASLTRARQFSWQRCLSQTIDAYKKAAVTN